MKSKMLMIDGNKGYVGRQNGYTQMEYFRGMYVTADGEKYFSSTSDEDQFLRVMLKKNCVSHILVKKISSKEAYRPFIGSLFLVFQEDGKNKLTVLIAELDKEGVSNSIYFKMQHRDGIKLLIMAKKMAETWIQENGGRAINHEQILQLGFGQQ